MCVVLLFVVRCEVRFGSIRLLRSNARGKEQLVANDGCSYVATVTCNECVL